MQQLRGLIHSLTDIYRASTVSQALSYRPSMGDLPCLCFHGACFRGSRLVDSLTFGSCWCCDWTPTLFIHHSSQYPRFRSLRESDEHRLVTGSPSGVTCRDMHSQQVYMEWGEPGSPKTKRAILKCWVGKKRSPPYLILIVWRQEWESPDLAENSGQSHLCINKYNLGCVSITFLKIHFLIYVKWK